MRTFKNKMISHESMKSTYIHTEPEGFPSGMSYK